jgi:hypothetical protein
MAGQHMVGNGTSESSGLRTCTAAVGYHMVGNGIWSTELPVLWTYSAIVRHRVVDNGTDSCIILQ